MLQPKNIGWVNGHKSRLIYAVYKRSTSDLGTYTDSKRGEEKSIPCKYKLKKKARVAIFTQDKIDFQVKLDTIVKEGH